MYILYILFCDTIVVLWLYGRQVFLQHSNVLAGIFNWLKAATVISRIDSGAVFLYTGL